MTSVQIRQRLETILEFMQPYWDFVNCHMVNFLTDKHWDHFIPAELKSEVSNTELARQCIESEFWQHANSKQTFPFMANFIRKCKQNYLEEFKEIIKTKTELKEELGLQNKEISRLAIKEFLTDKKRHEVEIMAEMINELIAAQTSNKDFYIIDAGDGKGYLSSRLALQYGHKVLGIDANEMNTENALERNRKLQRAWTGLVKRAELEEKGIKPPRRSKKRKELNSIEKPQENQAVNYRTTARFINENLNLNDLLIEHFGVLNNSQKIVLTGLHTCGNLAPTCLRVFLADPTCRILCNIGCCYHFLKEAFTTSKWEHSSPYEIAVNQNVAGFPMSRFMREKQIKLGRNARMLAAQCMERTLTAQELPNISLFYRALLEVLILKQYPNFLSTNESVQVGRIRKFENFQEYINQCILKTNLIELKNLEIKNIMEIQLEYAEQRVYLEIFYLIRMLFAPILETIILLDRLLFLTEEENICKHSFLVKAFDAVISPRRYAIIALKD